MMKSNAALEGAQQFTIKVSKGEDGKSTASCPQQPGCPPVTASETHTAISQFRTKLQHFIAGGKGKGL